MHVEARSLLLRLISLLAAITGVLSTTARGQLESLPHPGSSRLAAQESRASRYLERVIANELQKYYADGTFLVDARVRLASGELEPVFGFPPGGASDIEALPGLPVLPYEMRSAPPGRGGDAGRASGAEYTVESIAVEVMVDTSFDAKDAAFIRNLVNMAADLNAQRGDQVNVREGVFPVHKGPLSGYRLAEMMDGEAEKKPGTGARADNPFKPYVDNLASLLPLLIVCLFVVLVVWMVTRATLAGIKRRNEEGEAYTTILSEIQQLRSNLPTERSRAGLDEDDGPAEQRALRSFLLNACISDASTVAGVLKGWIKLDGARGLRNVAGLVKGVDERLMDLLQPELPRDMVLDLREAMRVDQEGVVEDLSNLLSEFKRDFQKTSRSIVDEDASMDLFGFLRQLNPGQVMLLLKGESEGVIAVMLAQLEPEKTVAILQRLKMEMRTKILARIGKIDKIPLKLYKELAERMSRKALEVVRMRYVAADGVESVLEVLDSLPLTVQTEYLKSIAEMDLQLAQKIKDQFITLPELSQLPDGFLGNILRRMEPDTLIVAMVNVEEEARSRMIGLLPERMQLMVRSGLESRADAPAQEIESAQRKLLSRVRDEIKTAGGRPQ